MKKLIPVLLLAAVSCSSAFAAESSMALTTGTSTKVLADGTGCLILATSVQVGLSANVNGSVFCRQADGVDPSTIMMGTCHTGGLTKSRDITCTRTLQDDASYTYAPSTCGEANFPADLPATAVTVTGPSMYSGNTSTGGGLAENNMDEVCNSANVKADIDALAAGV